MIEDVNPDKLSVTELEYRRARHEGIPRLIPLLDQNILWPDRHFDSPNNTRFSEQNIYKFRDKLLQEGLVVMFSNPEELADKVLKAVFEVTEIRYRGVNKSSETSARWRGRTVVKDANLVPFSDSMNAVIHSLDGKDVQAFRILELILDKHQYYRPMKF